MTHYKVTLLPLGKVIEVDEKVSLLEALKAAGIYIKSTCGGVASCSDCIVKVVTGEDFLVPPSYPELKLLGNVFHITKERLSCQTRICGNVTIDITEHQKGQGLGVSPKKKNDAKKKMTFRLKKRSEVELEKQAKEEKRYQERQANREQQTPNDLSKNKRAQEEGNSTSWKNKRNSHAGKKRPRPFKYNAEDEKMKETNGFPNQKRRSPDENNEDD